MRDAIAIFSSLFSEESFLVTAFNVISFTRATASSSTSLIIARYIEHVVDWDGLGNGEGTNSTFKCQEQFPGINIFSPVSPRHIPTFCSGILNCFLVEVK